MLWERLVHRLAAGRHGIDRGASYEKEINMELRTAACTSTCVYFVLYNYTSLPSNWIASTGTDGKADSDSAGACVPTAVVFVVLELF